MTNEELDSLLAFGEEESTRALKFKEREQYQFWQGWIAALQRVIERQHRFDVSLEIPVLKK